MSYLLLESGFRILLENNTGAEILLEGSSPPAQYFEQALPFKALSSRELTAFTGNAIFKTGIPQTYNFAQSSCALTYEVPSKPYGHVLAGSDGTATARIKLRACSYGYGTAKQLAEAVWNGIDGIPGTWGDGSCQIVSVVHTDESDDPISPKAGTDQWIYRVSQEYAVMYRVAIPTLS